MFPLDKKIIDFDDVRHDLLTEANTVISASLEQSAISPRPQFIHLCGIPGAGKTTYAVKWLAKHPDFSLVQFDDVMEHLAGYQKDQNTVGPVEAFKRWELPARAIGYHLLQALLENNRNILFDHSATNRQHLDLLPGVKERGYRVQMHYIRCSPDIAVERVKAREKISGRHTPETLIYGRHALLLELLPLYRNLVDQFIVL